MSSAKEQEPIHQIPSVEARSTLKHSITSTDFYLDSMRGEVRKLDIMDVRSVDKVTTTFLYRGVGDSIYYKLKRSFSLATAAVRNKQQRDAIVAASDSLIGDLSSINWKNKYFGLTGSFGANAILYSFQTELFKIGTNAVTP
ncbi:MAG: hypothetical protein EOO04_06390 [Chitinophagaceae bacterium]|nr:MAG: hypothetical protein EOO04_06390 [Chitinophagaceae bacterium]